MLCAQQSRRQLFRRGSSGGRLRARATSRRTIPSEAAPNSRPKHWAGSSSRICGCIQGREWSEPALATVILDCFDAGDLRRTAAPIGQRRSASTGERMPITLQLANRPFVLLVALDRETAEDRRDDLPVMRDRSASLLCGLLQDRGGKVANVRRANGEPFRCCVVRHPGGADPGEAG